MSPDDVMLLRPRLPTSILLAETGGIEIKWYENPLFINSKAELSSFFKPTKKKLFQR